MERINLSRNEKTVLRNIASKTIDDTFLKDFKAQIDSLSKKGLVSAYWGEGHELVDARISSQGRLYIGENPKLKNKTDWAKVSAIAAIVGVVVTVVGWFVACAKLL